MLDFISNQEGPRVVVCCGSGGVGKTTISATLGLQGALAGKKVLVLTIDPARRLADSLGLAAMGYDEQRIPESKFSSVGLYPKGQLYAMMLDTKRTFDTLITRHANESTKRSIFKNRYYQHLSNTLAGSHEYMAMEKLYEIYNEDKYDLIVLDTPPSRHALDFLDAPNRITDLLGHNFFWKLVKPSLKASKVGIRMLSFIASPIFKVVSQVMGNRVFEDVIDFFKLWDNVLFEGFQQRATSVKQMLSSRDTRFLIIASPMEMTIREAAFLHQQIQANNIPFGGFIINRVHPIYNREDARTLFTSNIEALDARLMEKLKRNYDLLQKLGRSDAAAIESLQAAIGADTSIQRIPYFDRDVYDFEGLLKILGQLFDPPVTPPPTTCQW